MKTFSERVVACAQQIPFGKVTTYGRIAKACGGGTMASQSITSILSKAWEEGVKDIPFHRIVYANGSIWIDAAHRKERLKKYKEEGISLTSDDRIANFEEKLHEFL